MKIFKIEQQYKQYLSQELNFEPNISIVCDREMVDFLLDEVDFEHTTFSKELDNEKDFYLIDKIEDGRENIHLFIEPLEFNEEGELNIFIENDFVIVDNDILDKKEINKMVDAQEELIVVDCNYEDDEDIQIETIEEFAEIMADTVIDEITKDLENGECPYCTIKKKLMEMFLDGYNTAIDEIEDED